MKIRKLYTILCCMVMMAQTVHAQQNMYVVGDNGSVNAVAVSSVSYATFNASDKWFTFSNDGIEGATKNLIKADCTVKLAAESEVKSLSVTPEVGVCYSKDNAVPTIEDDCLSLGSKLKSYTFTLESLISGTTYYFRPYVKLANAVFYGDIDTAKTRVTTDNSKIINGHMFIDLGLPSGLLWAETNIGAETAADDGNYYAWGETKPQRTNSYEWSSYKYGSSNSDSEPSKYNDSDHKDVLDKEDDAAYVNWGSSCRMPTRADFKELLNSDNCTWTWTSQTTSSGSSVEGYKVTGPNGNSIFLPVSGYRTHGNLYYHGSYGRYWSSTLITVGLVYTLHIGSSIHSWRSQMSYEGVPVRPVAEP